MAVEDDGIGVGIRVGVAGEAEDDGSREIWGVRPGVAKGELLFVG